MCAYISIAMVCWCVRGSVDGLMELTIRSGSMIPSIKQP